MDDIVNESDESKNENTFKFERYEELDMKCVAELLKYAQKNVDNEDKLADKKKSKWIYQNRIKICSCKICGKSFIRQKKLRNHIEATHWTKECESCNRIMVYNTYRKHVKSCKTYSCTVCDFQTKFKQQFTRHSNQHKEKLGLPAIKKTFNCENCNHSTKTKSNLQRHILHMHSPKHECNVCGRKMSSQTVLEKHKERKHSSIFKCEPCKKQYTMKIFLERHFKTEHGGQKSPKEIPYRHCSHCSYKSTKKYNLELHIQNAHTNPKPKRSKTCPKCYKTFTRLCNMKKHQEHCAGKEILIAF